ncbi:hypothetical protein APSETT444_000373 [Aspergillus pseudonomiae]
MADIDDDEAPPALVDVSQIPDAEQQEADAPSESRVPITLVTATDIEKPLTVNQDGQEVTEWMEVGNGCICCSVK